MELGDDVHTDIYCIAMLLPIWPTTSFKLWTHGILPKHIL